MFKMINIVISKHPWCANLVGRQTKFKDQTISLTKQIPLSFDVNKQFGSFIRFLLVVL